MKLKEYRKNVHQTHAEDLVLLGKEGLTELNDKIDKFIRRFNSEDNELNLTQKIDGAPALFCWSSYPGYPDNSIALKGFTSGPQNALSSNEQIDAKYGDRPDMAAKLKLGLQLAKHIPAGECWQGDCLFSKDDLKEETINGKDYLTFMPNKIVYAFSEDNADYNKVKNSDFGIAFHTIYKDKDGEMRQGFNVDPTRLNVPDNFYIMSPAINASKDKADYDLSALEKEYNNLKQLEQKLINDPAYEELVNNSTFMNYWNTFENANLADKKQVNLNINTFIGDLKEYVNDKLSKEYNKKLNTVKTDKGRQSATDKYNKDTQELANLIDTHKDTLTNLVNCLNSAANIKMLMWAGLKKAKNDYSTFYKSRTKGYIPSEGEGIAMSTDDGNIVKIVDRAKFSNINRDDDYLSGFMHESILNEYKKIPVPSKEELIDNYITKNLRLSDLANLYNTNTTTIKKWLNQYDIKKDKELASLNLSKTLNNRTPEEIANVQAKAKQTSLDRYGDPNYRNPEKNIETNKKNHDGKYTSSNQQKYQDTLKNSYGSVENAYKQRLEKTLKTKELKYGDKNYNNPEKTAETNLKKYGVRAPSQNRDIFSKMNKPYHYDNEKFSSSWELAYYIYNKDNNINIEHEPIALEYYSNNKKYIYIPDFRVNGDLIEIKGDHFIDDDGSLIDFYGKSDGQRDRDKLKCMIDNNVKILTWKDIKPYIKYIKDTYGKDYLKSFKDNNKNNDFEHESLQNEDFSTATQMADMGTFAKKPVKFSSKKKLKLEEDGSSKTAVIAAGRLNPPTIGHQKMIDALVSYAQGTKPKLFVTHTVDNKKNPLSYDSKVRWCQKAFGDKVEIPNTNAKTILQFLQELYQQGYTDIIYVGGGDRIGGAEDVTQTILKYNGQPDKQGNIIYDFNSIDFKNAGERTGDDLASNASASMARKDVLENDFNHFKQIVPFNESDAKKLFKELKYAMTGKKESFLEACNKRIRELNEKAIALTKSKYTPEVQKELNKELKQIDTELEAPKPNMGQDEYKAHKDDYKGLFVKQGSAPNVVYSPKDITKIFDNEAHEVVSGIENIAIETDKGDELKLSPTGATVLGEDKFNNTETTLYQEAIYSLLLAKRIPYKNDLKEWLRTSDPSTNSGIFKYIDVNYSNESLFKNKWINFIKDWGKAFEVIQEQRDLFISKANGILKGDVTKAVILHPAVKSPYQDIAKVLLSGADKFDKSDVYYCVNNVNKLTKQIAELKNQALSGNFSDYVEFMQNHSDEIIGVSLKKPGANLHVDWDIAAKDLGFFNNQIKWLKSDASSQKVLFTASDNETYILNIRPNSQKLGSKGTIEWQEKGAKAAMGKAFTAIKRVLGEDFANKMGKLMVEKNYIEATEMLLKVIIEGNPQPDVLLKLSKRGKPIITKIFNIACGFGATDDSGVRVTAPYIKVY